MMIEKWGKKLLKSLGNHDFDHKTECHFQEIYSQIAQFYKVCDFLPFESFEDGIFYNHDSVGFVIETIPLVGSSEQMQKEISNLFSQILPVESSLQIMLWADPFFDSFLCDYEEKRNHSSSMLKKLAKKRADFLKSFSFDSPHPPYSLRNFRCFLSFSQRKSNSLSLQKEELLSLQTQLKTTLDMIMLPSKVWEPYDLLNTIDTLFNLKGNNKISLGWNKLMPLSDHFSSHEKSLRVEHDALVINDETVIKTYSVRKYPEVWSLHAMSDLIGDLERDQAQIPCPFMIHYGVYIPKQEKEKTKILAKSTYVEKQAYSPIGKYLPNLQKEAEELSFVRSQISKGERIVQTHFGIILFSKSHEIANAEQILLNLFTSKEWRLEKNRFLHFPMFLTSLPMMWGEDKVRSLLHLQKLKTTLSTEAINLLPLQGEWHGTQTKSMILSGRRGQIFAWSPFDNDAGNYNVCVVGRSGSGKSVFMQELMASTLGLEGRVFVLDVGRSFEKTCFFLKGQFIEFTPKSPLCLNPFSTIPTHNEEVTQDALSMLKSILILMAAPSDGVDDKGAALLEQAMLETWEKYKTNCTITLIADWLLNHNDVHARDLGFMLYPYTTKGTYGRFFDGKSTLNLDNPLVVIELEELKERKDLQSVVVQMMIINITNKMFLGDRKTPFHIVFDEAWDMLKGKQSGVFIETLARRLRKYRGSLIVGTQSINDFFINPGAQAAFDNADWMCLLSQKPESIEYLKQTNRMSLSPQKESLLKSVKTKHGAYAEVMISGSNGYAIGRLILDPFSNLLYSTKAEDYAEIYALKTQGFSTEEAIEMLLSQREKSC